MNDSVASPSPFGDGYTILSAVAEFWPFVRAAALEENVKRGAVDALPFVVRGVVSRFWPSLVDRFGPTLLRHALEIASLKTAPWLLPLLGKFGPLVAEVVAPIYAERLAKLASLLRDASSYATSTSVRIAYSGDRSPAPAVFLPGKG